MQGLLGKRVSFKTGWAGDERDEGEIRGGFCADNPYCYPVGPDINKTAPPLFFIVAVEDPEKKGVARLEAVGFHQLPELVLE